MAGEKRPDSRGMSFFDITDFSPGIYSNSNIVEADVTSSPGVFPAPPGAADGNNTWGCKSMPNGGLGPGPARTATQSYQTWGIGFGASEITALTNSFITANDELVIGVNGLSGGGVSQTTEFFSYVLQTGSLNPIHAQSDSFSSAGLRNYCCYPYAETISDQIVIVLPLTTPDGPLAGNIMVYPSVAAPTAFSVDSIATRQAGVSFGHQGRIVVMARQLPLMARRPDPAGTERALRLHRPPPDRNLAGPRRDVRTREPLRLRCGELPIGRRAVLRQGPRRSHHHPGRPQQPHRHHLARREVHRTPYGAQRHRSERGPTTASTHGGAWAWNGGNTSVKDHPNNSTTTSTSTSPDHGSGNYGYYVQRWEEWMMFSNNWMLDTNTGELVEAGEPRQLLVFWYVPGFPTRYVRRPAR